MSKYGLEVGTPDIKSVGSITFGPEGILFVADNVSAQDLRHRCGRLWIARRDPSGRRRSTSTPVWPPSSGAIDGMWSSGTWRCTRHLRIVYLSVMRGRGVDAAPLIVRVERDGSVAEVPLSDVAFSQTDISDAPAEDDERVDGRIVLGGRRR